MSIDKESFWLGGIAFFIILMIQTHFFPNKFEEKDCTKEEILKLKTIK